MTPLCATTTCTSPGLLICELCGKTKCPRHYGAGSSSRCRRCWYEAMAEQAQREVRA